MATEQKTVAAVLRAVRRRLAEAGIETAELDARLLAMAVLEVDHAGLILGSEKVLPYAALRKLEELVIRREAHEPVSRIVGAREFYGREFILSPGVLDPRPDTETLIETALEFAGERSGLRILDLGCGSGAIIVTLLAEMPHATGVACDLHDAPLEITSLNAKRFGVADRLEILKSDWLDNISGRFDLVVSNPPYIGSDEISILAPEVRLHDPVSALDGGADGLACYERIIPRLPGFLRPNGAAVFEIGETQAARVQEMLIKAGLGLRNRFGGVFRDLAGRDRVVAAGVSRAEASTGSCGKKTVGNMVGKS